MLDKPIYQFKVIDGASDIPKHWI